jgi:hypothetical protein
VEGLSQEFEKWGPRAGICLDLVREPRKVAMFETIARDAARVYASGPERYPWVQATVSLCASQFLFTSQPSESRMTSFVTIKTNFLRNFVASAVAELDAAAQVKFFTQTSKHPWFEPSSEYIFEKFVITWLFSTDLGGITLYSRRHRGRRNVYTPPGWVGIDFFYSRDATPS